MIDFGRWFNESYGDRTPWGEQDSPAVVAAVESSLERSLSSVIMSGDTEPTISTIDAGADLVRQGEEGTDVYLILDGIFCVVVDGDEIAEIGPGAVVGERAALRDGTRTATLAGPDEGARRERPVLRAGHGCARRSRGHPQAHGGGLISRPRLLAILALPAGAVGYVVTVNVLSGLGLPDVLLLIVPLFVAALCMAPFVLPLFDQMAKRDLAAHRAQQATEAEAADPEADAEDVDPLARS